MKKERVSIFLVSKMDSRQSQSSQVDNCRWYEALCGI